MGVTARIVLGPFRLLQDELARLRLAPYADARLTIGIAVGMLLSLFGAHTFGYRLGPSAPVTGTATKAREVLGGRGPVEKGRGAAGGSQQTSPSPDRRSFRPNEIINAKR
ncbi:MAG TPA: hypothetical protein VG125_30375 [Pirellulales bacterium]|jgi:hypothetical protein|nr:hypothetical protein [Pirellulales bacterium]